MEPMHPLRDHRRRRAWTQEEVAERLVRLGLEEGTRGLGADAKMVGRWERGERKPRHPYPQLLCLLFDATPAELGLAPSPYLQPRDTLEAMDRRTVLGMFAAGFAVPIVGRGKTRDISRNQTVEAGDEADRLAYALRRPSKADEEAAATVESLIAGARRLDDLMGSRHVVRSAVAYRDIIRTLLDGGPPLAVARPLTVAAGGLSQFLGHLAFDMNDDRSSRPYLEESLKIAHETDCHNLGAYALGWLSVVEVAGGRPQEGKAFAEAARSWAEVKASAATRSWLAAAEADALAELGDSSGAERALERARKMLARSKAEDEPPWMYYYDRSSLDHRAGSVYVTLGLAEPARRAMRQAIATSDTSMVRDRAWYLGLLGQTYVLDGEVDEACRVAGQALTIASDTLCDRAVLRVRELRAQLKPWESEPMVRDLDNQLAATTSWCPPVAV